MPEPAPFSPEPAKKFMRDMKNLELKEIVHRGFTCDREKHYYADGAGAYVIYTCRCLLGRRAGTL